MQFLSIPDCLVFRDFSWSPTDNKIAYWVPGRDSIPAKITIIEIPSRKEGSPRCFRGGCVSYGTNCAPFWGEKDKELWVVVGCVCVGVGGGGGENHQSKLRLMNGCILGKSITQLPSSASPMPFWPINIATHLPQIGQCIAGFRRDILICSPEIWSSPWILTTL